MKTAWETDWVTVSDEQYERIMGLFAAYNAAPRGAAGAPIRKAAEDALKAMASQIGAKQEHD
jgi:hypothetical protein